jgi:hypothetical protein
MKTVKIVLKSRRGGRGKMMEGVNPAKIYYKHIGEHHTISPYITIIC